MAITQITGLFVAYTQVIFKATDITAGVVRQINIAPSGIPPEFIAQAQAVLENNRLYEVKVYDVYVGALTWTNVNKSEYSNDKSGLAEMIADMPGTYKYLPTPEGGISTRAWITPEAIGAMNNIDPDFIDWVTDLIDDATSDLGAKYRTVPILQRMLAEYIKIIGQLPPAPPVPAGRPLTPPITSEEIAANAVTPSKIPDGSLTAAKFAAGQLPAISRPITPPVVNAEIADSAVTKIKLASNSVGYLEIIDGSVTTPKIVNGAVTPEKLSFVPGGAVRPLVPPVATGEIADNAVETAKIADLNVTTGKVANGAVTRPKLLYKSVEVIIPAYEFSGESAPDPELVGGEVLGYYPLNDRGSFTPQIIGIQVNGSVRISRMFEGNFDDRFRVVVLRP